MRTLYIVQEVHWTYSDEWYYENGARPTRAYAIREHAEAHRVEKENAAREEIASHIPEDEYEWWSQNLAATFGGLENVTSQSESALNARLAELGVAPHAFDAVDHWLDNAHWRSIWQTLDSPTKRDAAWQLFDKVRFYEVVGVEADL